MERKRAFLRDQGIGSLYYVSHAPFLFMAEKLENLVTVRQRLVSVGIPQARFQPYDDSTA